MSSCLIKLDLCLFSSFPRMNTILFRNRYPGGKTMKKNQKMVKIIVRMIGDRKGDRCACDCLEASKVQAVFFLSLMVDTWLFILLLF